MAEAKQPLLIVGASARGAAFSALRAGLQPWCADLFADLDLQARCSTRRVQGDCYPLGFVGAIDADLPRPWRYTGALENHPSLVGDWQRRRTLWGVRSECLEWVRDPLRVARIIREEGLPAPLTLSHPPEDGSGPWLVKVLRSAGGAGVREWVHD